ncbi:MAG: hypothetical protein SFW07_05425 [Gammaproteobacteria bacterium]|nr:hypothetical protein [Gammaproteobacteria bacterium]
MIHYVRRNKDPYSWSYHDDLIAARGDELRYHVSLGIGAEFETFLEKFHHAASKHFNPIYFLSASETDSRMPMIGMISDNFAILRVLEHPIAKEFLSYIPWIYRDTFSSMKRLLQHIRPSETLPEIYKAIEDIRWVNHKIARRSMLDEVIQQLNLITFNRCWEAIPSEMDFESWMVCTTQKFRKLLFGEQKHLILPLPYNDELHMPMIIFWLQLLDLVLGYRYRKWKVYWSDEKLVLMNGPHEPSEVVEILLAKSDEDRFCKMGIGCQVDPEMTLMKLLSCWGAKLKLQ